MPAPLTTCKPDASLGTQRFAAPAVRSLLERSLLARISLASLVSLVSLTATSLLLPPTSDAASAPPSTPRPSTTTPSATAVPSGDRVPAEPSLRVAPKALVRRAVLNDVPVSVRSTVRFSDYEHAIGLSGTIDPYAGSAELVYAEAGERQTIRVIGPTVYFALTSELRRRLGADWLSTDLEGLDPPIEATMILLLLQRSDLIRSVPSWKDVTSPADRSAHLLHVRGTGDVLTLSALDPSGYRPDVRVDVWLTTDAKGALVPAGTGRVGSFPARVDWRIFPDPTSDDAQGATSTARYREGRELTLDLPEGTIKDLDDVDPADAQPVVDEAGAVRDAAS